MDMSSWTIEIAAHKHGDMLCAFSCGEGDEYVWINQFVYGVVDDPDTVTYIVYDKKTMEIVGIFSLCCSAIILSGSDRRGMEKRFVPSIEIKMFALAQAYQHQRPDELAGHTVGDLICSTMISIIRKIAREFCGAKEAVLYATDDGPVRFYTRNGFGRFDPYMEGNPDPYNQGCTPMFMTIE